ncbi:hypothetical protein [Gilvibacter sp.]|uniref:hypothetical protein n=1 Tax=Gilvibacter sp. TaxID=2729997 RepID=UPI0035BE230F
MPPREVALNALHGRALRYIFALSAKDAAATSQEARAALLLGRWRGGFFHILKLHEYLFDIFIFLLNFVLQAVSSQDNNIFN